jgi:hypothetical protein
MAPGKVKIGAEILLRIGREFGKSIEWAADGQELVKHALTKLHPQLVSF